MLVQDLIINARWVFLEYKKNQSKLSCSELRCKDLVEELKCDSCRVMFKK